MRSPVTGGAPPWIRRHNRAAVLRVILSQGPISRLDIGRITGMTPATVSHIVSALIAQGHVSEVGAAAASGAGRRPILVDLRSHGGLVAAIDIRMAAVRF